MAVSAIPNVNGPDLLQSAGASTTAGGASNAKRAGNGGNDFNSVIDATTLSVLAGTQLQPQASVPVRTGGISELPTTVSGTQKAAAAVSGVQTAPGRDRETSFVGTDRKTSGRDAQDGAVGVSEMTDDVRGAGGEMVRRTAEEFDLSEEELADLMAQLGLTGADLLNPEGLTELVAAINGEDTAALLTDGELYQSLQELQQTAQELRQRLGETWELDEDALQKTIDGIAEEEKTPDFADAAARRPEDDAEGRGEQERVYTVTRTDENGNTRTVRVSVNDESGRRTMGDEQITQTARTPQENEQASGGMSGQGRNQGRNEFAENPGQAIYNTLLQNVSQTLETEAAQNAALTANVNAQELVDQIEEYLRVQMKPDLTRMEMQLNPETLGRLNISLTSLRDGNIVAQFTAQDESVRAALQTQLPQLQQKLEEQGIRVNAVEVLVDQRQYEQDGRDERRQAEAQEAAERSVRGLRRINLSGLNGAEDAEDTLAALDEADRITAEMMAANGNTVDYSA